VDVVPLNHASAAIQDQDGYFFNHSLHEGFLHTREKSHKAELSKYLPDNPAWQGREANACEVREGAGSIEQTLNQIYRGIEHSNAIGFEVTAQTEALLTERGCSYAQAVAMSYPNALDDAMYVVVQLRMTRLADSYIVEPLSRKEVGAVDATQMQDLVHRRFYKLAQGSLYIL
jgi:hypothetical protein